MRRTIIKYAVLSISFILIITGLVLTWLVTYECPQEYVLIEKQCYKVDNSTMIKSSPRYYFHIANLLISIGNLINICVFLNRNDEFDEERGY